MALILARRSALGQVLVLGHQHVDELPAPGEAIITSTQRGPSERLVMACRQLTLPGPARLFLPARPASARGADRAGLASAFPSQAPVSCFTRACLGVPGACRGGALTLLVDPFDDLVVAGQQLLHQVLAPLLQGLRGAPCGWCMPPPCKGSPRSPAADRNKIECILNHPHTSAAWRTPHQAHCAVPWDAARTRLEHIPHMHSPLADLQASSQARPFSSMRMRMSSGAARVGCVSFI